ncbi:histidinol-phosphate transaminase [Miniimonas arenae]|uniref:Aromatic amino acid aminotransferase n=1 Tax=Miniimonas arenae TaxID=676201 RepID=A0A5C5BBS8_9MICO|nr:histidinol-phosphate transaminase [Miniimonas arenae]TNU75042.1 histidinol-phosphate transaminase [Miniimonas arenae]
MAAKKVRLRDQVISLPAYVPGARPRGTMNEKLSSNENPYPPLPRVVAAVSDAAADLNRYPDMLAGELVEAIATMFGLDVDQVVVGNGSVAVLESILAALCERGDEVVYPWRSFEAYPIAVAVAGATGVPVPLLPDGRHDVDAMIAAITPRTKAVLLCSPNNPTGPALTDAEVRRILAALPPDVMVLLDEAYIEFVRKQDEDEPVADGVAILREDPRLVLLRTFSKAYGLAGLRVGFALGRSRLVSGFRATSTPFGVNALAQVAALESLRAHDQLMERVDAIVDERERVVAGLRAQGWDIPEAQGNFVWFPVGDEAGVLARAFAESGVLVRPFAGDGVRVSIGEREANDIVLAVAAEYRDSAI